MLHNQRSNLLLGLLLRGTQRKVANGAPATKRVRSVTTSSSSQVPVVNLLSSVKSQHRSSCQAHDEDSSFLPEDQQTIISQNKKNNIRLEQLHLWHSLETIKRNGHRLAQLDPLGLSRPERLDEVAWAAEAALVSELRQNKELVATNGLLASSQKVMPISEIIESIYAYYVEQGCGLEFGHMTNRQEVEWLEREWESLNENFAITREEEEDLAKLMLECEQFDHFMALKYPTTKRYGCEGAESMLIVFDELLRQTQLADQRQDRIEHLIIGMPHRGRLNLLACLLGQDPALIFNKCQGEPELDLREAWMATGDVLSHLSINTRFVYGVDRHHVGLFRESPDPINVSLLPNPSHLEVASPMVVGAVRGRAHNIRYGYSSSPKFPHVAPVVDEHEAGSTDEEELLTIDANYRHHMRRILPIQVHGDASLAGQGIIQETLQMSNLPQFSAGGSIHLVVNNQIGFTTPSWSGRSSRHCTDVFKLIEAPVIHVNGENIHSLLKATRLALKYRQTFHKDVALDLICFRLHGHNEMDEPAFTQPLMYSNIRQRKSIPEKYCDFIALDQDKRQQIVSSFKERLQDSYKNRSSYRANNDDFRNFALPSEFHRDHLICWRTGCNTNLLRHVAQASVQTPQNFQLHPTLKRTLVEERLKRFNETQSDDSTLVDWATAEILAFGSLLCQNHSVRIAGQDVARGTFSTRHAALFDQASGKPYVPLNWMPQLPIISADNLGTDQSRAKLEIANTILSEEAALAYEFAYSMETCELTIWEAQFGDFFNTAQSVIDTLISSSESKWLRQSSLTMLLPHGLDGAGPEHSSSHLERFLQMSSSKENSIDTEASVNWSICFPTLPSQYFHLLRRQVLRPFRKPLVVMSPKAIFRHSQCQSPLSHFGPDETFKPVLDDPRVSGSKSTSNVDTLVLCSGKVYFQLNELREKNQMSNVAIIRLEELCPFPIESLMQIISNYPNIKPSPSTASGNLIWFQEEHQNQGAYHFVETRLSRLVASALPPLRYMGRPVSELPATGSSSLHKRELDQLTKDFITLKRG